MSKELRNENGNANQNDQLQKNYFGNLELFSDQELGSVRCTLDADGGTWFVLSDVCKILDIANPSDWSSILKEYNEWRSVDRKSLTLDSIEGQKGGPQSYGLITESGLYRVIFKSRKPAAEKFITFVVTKILPSIRKHGSYVMNQENLDPEELDKLRRDLQKLRSDHEALGQQYDDLKGEYDELLSDYKDLYDKNKPVLQEKQLIIDPEGFVMLKEAWKPVL